ncbi:hypothetical protein M422DRAFT_250222 [Sphaerobolus stellatus SS14]|uniref:Uncharacterized protein n=1 Tax=Sphaerobolus stellatus (strain SS14) TaxID=990650 RepID=A0A0C9W363_SPHS4|nr:hypothetical protein M422DRAFT_250222 [Sphaerobolus stellatus SS14]
MIITKTVLSTITVDHWIFSSLATRSQDFFRELRTSISPSLLLTAIMLLQAEYDALFKLLNSLSSTLLDRPSTSNLPPQIDLEFTAEEGAWPAFNKVMYVTFSEFGHDLCSQDLSSEHNFTVSINWNIISL